MGNESTAKGCACNTVRPFCKPVRPAALTDSTIGCGSKPPYAAGQTKQLLRLTLCARATGETFAPGIIRLFLNPSLRLIRPATAHLGVPDRSKHVRSRR